MHVICVSVNPARGKAQGRIVFEARKRSFEDGPQTGIEAQKPNIHIIPDLPLELLLSFSFASGGISPTKINRVDEANAKGTWARPIRNDRLPVGGSKPAKGMNPMSAAGRARGKDHSPDQAANARAAG